MNGSIPTGSAVRLVDPAREHAALPASRTGLRQTQGPSATGVAGSDVTAAPKAVQPAREVAGAVSEIRDFVQMVRRELQFEVDDDTGRTVVTVRDAKTEEVIRQIPSEEVLEIAARLEEVSGVLFRERA